MKSTSTLKHLFLSACFVLAGALVVSAQENAAGVSGASATLEAGTYRISVPSVMAKSGDEITGGTTSPGIDIKNVTPLRKAGTMIFDVNIPVGTPLGDVVFLSQGGEPLWHVTVADILGNSQGEGDGISLRPLHQEPMGSGSGNTGNNGNPNAISQPAPTTEPGSSLSTGTGGQPKIDLYPNPATDQITIVTEGEVLWGVTEIIDLTGKKILEIPTGFTSPMAGAERITVNISSLRTGLYLVRFRTNKDTYTRRIQVAK